MPITNSYLAHIRSTRPAVSTQQPVFPSTEPFHNDKDVSSMLMIRYVYNLVSMVENRTATMNYLTVCDAG